ncbi:precorrin-2 C(20)-methyltransferase [Palleronia caenipelagi]|uniref:Precorrin-2 C(20)-methyltransferase n=1 Tax=Palleronia caenipelagi TaxID=2489174 RepID=A0A547Q8F5_9RHOB|nr:precorrin-2 C(20)-methyltransferase [Palleronia caenipelagi]TRD22670.1 precorrin-2 C(20)-methyltransferase [Palleronia caenipelagi]
MTGRLIGVGLGPGDPELMSVRADRLIRGARHLAYFRKAGRRGRARKLIDALIAPGAEEIALEYPVTTEIPVTDPAYNAILAEFYDAACADLRFRIQGGQTIVVPCEGDPFFYGSFMHLYTRLRDDVPVEVVPGITGMSAAWTATGEPITWGDDVLSVVMATLPEDELTRRIAETDALVVMKIGRNFDKLCRSLRRAGKFDRAWLVECAAMEEQQVMKLSEAEGRRVPYFTIVMIHGQGRRP